jgi:hypothetical protein
MRQEKRGLGGYASDMNVSLLLVDVEGKMVFVVDCGSQPSAQSI